MSLIRIIKEAASVSITVPAAGSQDGHRKIERRRHNKLLPWLAGRKPAVRGSAAEIKSDDDIIKDAIYRWDNYNGMGGTPNPMKQVYNNLVHIGLQTMPSDQTMGGAISRGAAGVRRLAAADKAKQDAQTEQDNMSTWGLLTGKVDPGVYADSVLNSYNNQSTAGKIVGNIGAGLELGSWGVGGQAASKGVMPALRAAAPGIATGMAGGALSRGGPSATQKLMALPATWAANAQDRTYAKTTDYNNFQKLMQRGLKRDAAKIYPQLFREYARTGEVSAPYGIGQMAGTLLQAQPFR